MSKRLRLGEIRSVFELVERVTGVGRDVDAWRAEAINGLRRLLHAEVGFTADLVDGRPGVAPKLVRPLDYGWNTEGARRRYYDYHASGEVTADPAAVKLFQLHERVRFVTRTRRQMVDDRDWYDAPSVSEARRSGGVDDCLSSTFAIRPGVLQGFVLYRGWGGKPFDGREQRLLRFFHVQVLRRMTDSRSPIRAPRDVPTLSPRLRQTLDLLRDSLGTKEIAHRLDLSPHTINDYQKTLHKRFDVNSRAQLLSRCQHRPQPQLALPRELL